MIPFFRKIRWRLAKENKFIQYARYAIGEIVLVVIGILIALQVNNWNEQRLKKSKEKNYLIEIHKNLVQDTIKINETLVFNALKKKAIDESFKLFEQASEGGFNLDDFAAKMAVLSSFQVFEPTRTAFDNMLDVEKIDLITNTDLRLLLSNYYKTDFNIGTNEVIKIRTRAFTDRVATRLTTKESVYNFSGAELAIKTNADSKIYQDEVVIVDLMSMGMTMFHYNMELNRNKSKIKYMLNYLGSEIDVMK